VPRGAVIPSARLATQAAAGTGAGEHAAAPLFEHPDIGDVRYPAEPEYEKETFNWKLFSVAALPLLVGLSVYGYFFEQHEHSHDHAHPFDKPTYPYLRVATKKWPWQNKQCTYWEMDCHKAEDLKRKMGAHH